ncbi:hypothetical protein RIF29_21544 [Crotalaria pallida]|uniref:Uncharacterized protein n=1 Tax=Crotalaria pallida TaxID=3830 RepID=A0AAN9F5H7_CROPI
MVENESTMEDSLLIDNELKLDHSLEEEILEESQPAASQFSKKKQPMRRRSSNLDPTCSNQQQRSHMRTRRSTGFERDLRYRLCFNFGADIIRMEQVPGRRSFQKG